MSEEREIKVEITVPNMTVEEAVNVDLGPEIKSMILKKIVEQNVEARVKGLTSEGIRAKNGTYKRVWGKKV